MKRVISFLLAIVILCSSFAGLTMTASAANDYPYKNSNPDQLDKWRFYTRECTSFCAWRLNHNNGIAFTNFYGDLQWGNAVNWGKTAKKLGMVVDMKPTVGAIAWWTHTAYGHVAWVSAVKGDSVTVEEYNWANRHNYGTRTYKMSESNVAGYIHLACIGHSWNSGKVTKKATCTAEGQKVYTCTICNKTKTKAIAKIAHDYKKTIVKPTSTQVGYTLQKCAACGKTKSESAYTAPTGKVGGFKCKSRTASSQTVTWNKVNTAAGYQVQVTTKDGKKWDTLARLKASETSYTFKNLASGNNYQFRVRFFVKAGDGKNYVSPWAKLTSPTLPSATKLEKVKSGSKAFTAQWKKQSGITGYQIQYATDAGFTKNSAAVTVKSSNTLSQKVTGLKTGTKYYVRIRTYKKIDGTNYRSAWSNVLTVSTAKTLTQKTKSALVNHYYYRDIQTDNCDVEEYAFFNDGTFERKSLLVGSNVRVTDSDKGTFTLKGDEVVLHFPKKVSVGGSIRTAYDFVLYFTGSNAFVCDVSYNTGSKSFIAHKLYYSATKVKDSEMATFIKNFARSDKVGFKQKSTYYKYESMIDYYRYAKQKEGFANAYYNYTTLKTPYAEQKVLVITTYMSAYLERTYIYTLNKSGEITKIVFVNGKITRISKDLNYFLTSCYSGSGMGEFYWVKYNSQKTKYITAKKYPYTMQTRSSVQSQMEKLTKDFSQFDHAKYTIC